MIKKLVLWLIDGINKILTRFSIYVEIGMA